MAEHNGAKPGKKKRRQRSLFDLYRPSFPEQARKLASDGWIDTEIADFFMVPTNVLRRWKVEYPEFGQALQLGKDVIDDQVEESLLRNARGFYIDAEKVFCHDGKIVRAKTREYVKPDTKAQIYWLGCRRRAAWSQRMEFTGKDGQPLVPYEGNEFARRIAFALDPRSTQAGKPH